MNNDLIDFQDALRRNDGRWVALASAIVATLLVTVSMFSSWLVLPGVRYYDVEWTVGAAIATWCWLAAAIVVVGLAFAMVVAARRSYLPTLAPLSISIASVIGAIGMLLVIRQAQHLDYLSHALWFEPAERDVFTQPTIRVADGLWIGLAGFLALGVASGQLWRFARHQARSSRIALAMIDAQLAMSSGDLVEETNSTELVPTL